MRSRPASIYMHAGFQLRERSPHGAPCLDLKGPERAILTKYASTALSRGNHTNHLPSLLFHHFPVISAGMDQVCPVPIAIIRRTFCSGSTHSSDFLNDRTKNETPCTPINQWLVSESMEIRDTTLKMVSTLFPSICRILMKREVFLPEKNLLRLGSGVHWVGVEKTSPI